VKLWALGAPTAVNDSKAVLALSGPADGGVGVADGAGLGVGVGVGVGVGSATDDVVNAMNV
jgi:hypothetical protein